jgi:EmrB/QacA subfamily drug resistance transporter
VRARHWTLVATIIASSLTFIDATVINVALPALQKDLAATITDVQWVIEAYALFLGALMLVGGALGDQYGRKRVFLAGVGVFTLASIACGLAGSARALIAARAVQGTGAALLTPGSLAIISATFDGPERGRAIGTWSGFSAITSAVGPVAGGWLIEHVSWRAVFFINVPLAAVVVALSLWCVRESRDPSRGSGVDVAGAAFAVLGLGALVFGLLESTGQGGSRPFASLAIACGVILLAAFVVVEWHVPTPMLPPKLFRSRAFTLANVLTLLLYGSLSTVLWLLPMNLIEVQHYSATAAGAAFLPFPVLMFVLSRWSGGLVARVGSRVPLTIGPLVAAAGLALLARPGTDADYWTTFFPAILVLALGMAILVAPLTTTVMSAVETDHAGVASGVNNAVARVAGLLAIALFGILLVRSFDAHMRGALDDLQLPAATRAAIERELPRLATIDVSAVADPATAPGVARAIAAAFVSSFRLIMLTAGGVTLMAAGLGALIGPEAGAESPGGAIETRRAFPRS